MRTRPRLVAEVRQTGVDYLWTTAQRLLMNFGGAQLMAQQYLAGLIRSYMDVRGWTQAEAARHCGFTDSQMSSLLTRERRTWPDPETVTKLQSGLGIPCAETMDAVARDVGVGPLLSEAVRISEDPEIRATAQVIAGLPAGERRTLAAMVRAFVDNSDDNKS